jgi:hypothetical protein
LICDCSDCHARGQFNCRPDSTARQAVRDRVLETQERYRTEGGGCAHVTLKTGRIQGGFWDGEEGTEINVPIVVTREGIVNILARGCEIHCYDTREFGAREVMRQVKRMLRHEGVYASDASHTATEEQVSWARRHAEKLWPQS